MTHWINRMTTVGLAFGVIAMAMAGWEHVSVAGHPLSDTSGAPDTSVERTQNSQLTPYAAGDVIQLFGGVDFGEAERTLIAFIDTTCRFCSDSVGLYQVISNMSGHARASDRLQFVVAGREPIERLDTFATRYHLRPDRIVSVSPGEIKVATVPTLVLVDRAGVVQHVWQGEQTGAYAEAVLQRLRAVGH
jgi:hypothetical protein